MRQKQSTKVDFIVGRNIRIYRLAKGITQTALANELGISFQQVQKYEKGANRVGSGRLYQIGTVLGVPFMSFFKGAKGIQPAEASSPFDLLADPLSLRLVQAFADISERDTRYSVVGLVEAMSTRRKRK